MKKILAATKNPGKANEMRKYLGAEFDVVSLADMPGAPDVDETGATFEENSILKAQAYFAWSGLPTITDDGGLEIDALHGEPGVLSRRWPGHEATDEDLIALAFEKLNGVLPEKRTAHLVAVVTFFDGTHTLQERGAIDGVITESQTVPHERGYPFRAIFYVPKFHKTYVELSHEEHEEVNHRRAAYAALAQRIHALEPVQE